MPEYGANLAKYNAGGSGDNYVADGYIKTVEKIWMDVYTFAFVTTVATIGIAELPANKKITSIDVQILTAVSQTSGSISLGFATDALVNSLSDEQAICHNLTLTTFSLPYGGVGVGAGTATGSLPTKSAGLQFVTSGTRTTVAIRLDDWVATSGTIKTIVRYT